MISRKAIIAIAIVAMFAAVPVLSSGSADAEKSWTNCEVGTSADVSGIDSTIEARQIYETIDVLLNEGIMTDLQVEDKVLKSITDFSVKKGFAEKITDGAKLYQEYYELKGTAVFEAKVIYSQYIFYKSVLPYGELYEKMNSYFTYDSHDDIKITYDFNIKYAIKNNYEYKEASDVFVRSYLNEHSYELNDSKVTIELNGKSLTYNVKFEADKTQTGTYKFDSEISKSTEAPDECKVTSRMNIPKYEAKVSANVDGTDYTQYEKSDEKIGALRAKYECDDRVISTEVREEMPQTVNTAMLVKDAQSDDEARDYIKNSLDGTVNENYSDVSKKADSYMPTYSNGSGDSGTMILIIVAAVIVIVLVGLFLFKKKHA